MSHSLKPRATISVLRRRCLQYQSCYSDCNGQLYAASKLLYLDQRQREGRKRGRREQMRVPNCSSLPLSRLCDSPLNCAFYNSHRQVSLLLPHSSSLYHFQKTLPLTTSFPSLGDFGDYSDGGTRNNDEIDECQCENKGVVVNSSVDPEEVEGLCKVIDELFAFDSTMEAAVDGCSVNLTPDLVVNVLERFRHARKPALRFFNWTVERPGFSHNSRTYNSMMGIIGKPKQSETIVSMEEMDVNRVLTIETFEIAMRAFAEAIKRKKAVGMFKLMKYKYKVVLQTFDSLLDCLGKATLGKEAKAMFGKLGDRVVPNPRTCTVLLDGWCKVKNLMEAGRDRNQMIDKGFNPDVVAHNFMLQGLLKCRKRSDSIQLFEVMKAKGLSPNFWSCTILIPYLYLCNQRMMEDAIDCFDEMVDFGCVLDAPVYTCLITGFGNQKSVDMIHELLKKMKEIVCPLDVKTYNSIILLMATKRTSDYALRIYRRMIRCGSEVFDEMSRKRCCLDDKSLHCFVGGHLNLGRVGGDDG